MGLVVLLVSVGLAFVHPALTIIPFLAIWIFCLFY